MSSENKPFIVLIILGVVIAMITTSTIEFVVLALGAVITTWITAHYRHKEGDKDLNKKLDALNKQVKQLGKRVEVLEAIVTSEQTELKNKINGL